MENNDQTFNYRYSASQNREVENIIRHYLPITENKFEILKSLDYRVKRAGIIQGLTIGVAGCLIFGIGLCFLLNLFDGENRLAVPLLATGTAVMIPAYPIYSHISKKTREKLVPEILRLSDEMLKS